MIFNECVYLQGKNNLLKNLTKIFKKIIMQNRYKLSFLRRENCNFIILLI